jgi:hypothetical protein
VDGAAEIGRVMDLSPEFVVLRARPPGGPTTAALDDVIEQRLAGYRMVHEVPDSADASMVRIYRRQFPRVTMGSSP